jgi:plastocyanin/mono/diheme cytochrome c family protein
MTDQPGRPPEERLPAPRPPAEPARADRFSAPPATHRSELTPERAAGIVRQSGSARMAAFLAVTFIALFVIVYYFYELGAPGGLTEPRLAAELEHQQVTSIERGYNIYQANCARCHGVEGEGGSGPAVNRQDKLFAHLNPDYLRNILVVGGRYACGDPNSLMPIWSDEGNPPGPLNYQQINDLINFMRSEQGHEYVILDPELHEPVIDPATGQPLTFEGWVDPDYMPAPDATPYPACWLDEFTNGGNGNGGNGGNGNGGNGNGATPDPNGTVIDISAVNIAFDQAEVSAPADTPFQIRFENNDPGIPHNVEIRQDGQTVFLGELFNGIETRTYDVPALEAGTYEFICTVHPNMVGTLTVGS